MADGAFNQFVGGSFLQETSQAVNATQQQPGYQLQSQTVRCCTVKRILEAFQQSQDDRLYLDGQMLHTVALCGQLVQVTNLQDHFLLKIQDSSGCIQAKSWSNKLVVNLQQNDWVRAFGHVKSAENPGDAPYIMLFNVFKVEDPMQIIYHNLKVVQEHLLISKYGGGCIPINQGGMGQQQQYGTPGRSFQSPGVAATQMGNDPELESSVYNIIRNSQGGMHANTVMAQLGGRYQLHQIKEVLNNAVFSGRLYPGDEPEFYHAC